MKPLKFVLALLITFGILVGARSGSMRQTPPIDEIIEFSDYTLKHHGSHIFKGDTTNALMTVEVTRGTLPQNYKLGFYYRPKKIEGYEGEIAFSRFDMKTTAATPNKYEVTVINKKRGSEFHYYIRLENAEGNPVASMPASTDFSNPEYLWFRFEGARSAPLLIAHIAGMFGGFLFMTLTFLTAFGNVRNSTVNVALGKYILWTTIILFMGTFPIGIWLEYQVYGTYWTGIPLGRDKTDSKGLVVFLYWFILLILMKGSAFLSRPTKNWIKPIGARVVTIIGFIITAGLYLIPHSSGDF